MKTNHQRGQKKRQDHKRRYYGPIDILKQEARKARRSNERRNLAALRGGFIEADAAIFWTKNVHVSDMWRHD